MSRERNKELRMFEALEDLTKHESFDSTASFVHRFVNSDLDLNCTHQSIPEEEDEVEEEVEPPQVEEEEEKEVEEEVEPPQVEEEVEPPQVEEEEEVDEEEEEEVEEDEEEEQVIDESSDTSQSTTSGIGTGEGDYDDSSGFEFEETDEATDEDQDGGEIMSETGDMSHFQRCADEHESDFRSVHSLSDEDEEDYDHQSYGKDRGMLPLQSTSKGTDDELEELLQVLKNKHGTEYFLLSEMKRTVELQESQLKREQAAFSKVRGAELAKLQVEKKRVENQRKNLQSLITDYHKMKSSKDESQDKIKELTKKLRETKLEMSKRISRSRDQQKKLEERVKALEKENEDLKKQNTTIPPRRTVLKRPPMLLKPPNKNMKRIQFADDVSSSANQPSTSEVPAGPSKSKPNPSSTKPVISAIKHRPINQTSIPNASKLSRKLIERNSNEDVDDSNCDNMIKESNEPNFKEVSINDDDADKTMPSDYIEVTRPCGTITRVTKDNKFTRHIMINKDIMDEFEDCSVRYYYRELGFSQTSYPNGDEIIEYDSGVLETSRSDGSKIYTYSDGLVKLVDSSGGEEIYFVDGSVMKKEPNGECIVTWPSGQKEVRTAMFVKRIYTNGTVKIMYADGSEETRYYNGRVRRKNKDGILVDDTKMKTRKPKQTNPSDRKETQEK
ncbi:unnamed protein product [Orchesella dallaii]|uniref:Centromere protein J n=1 Tax=Orchesella dallaii TaxID=48710 RepID=A0ABP1Q4C0_9HEXA